MNSKKTVFTNANIITMDNKQKTAEAMIVENKKILELGSANHILNKYDNKEIIDLKGKTVIPGFNDGHLHLYSYAEGKNKVDLRDTKSCKDIIKKVKRYIRNYKLQTGNWIEGIGWNDENFINSNIPDKNVLDKITTKHPLILFRTCLHAVAVNSKALELSGIEKNTTDPDGGKIGRTDSGEANGLLYDNAIGLVKKNIPPKNSTQIKELLLTGLNHLKKAGITSVQTDDLLSIDNPNKMLKAYLELARENKLPIRVNLQMRVTRVEGIEALKNKGYISGYKVNKLHFGPIKLMLDGSLGARTAALIDPYSDKPETRGHIIYSQNEFNKIVLAAHKNGFQIAVHTIGDRALKMALDSYEKMLKEYPVKDARPLIIHAQISNKKLNKKMKKLGVIPVIQPIFLSSDWSIIEKRLGKDRAQTSYAWKQYLQEGLTISGSSDAPVEPINPLYGIYCAVTRKDLTGKPDDGWHINDSLSIKEALEIYTKTPAYQSFSEENKGSLTPGKFADFIVLSKDITDIKAEKIKDINVQQTYVGGECIYHK